MRRIAPICAAAAMALSACNQTTPPTPEAKTKASASPQTVMLRVAKGMQACWFGQKDPALKPFRMAEELNSFSGKPRVLIVPRRNAGGLPKMVVQAERKGGRTQLVAFGPLVDSKDGPRLVRAVRAWGRGKTACA